LVLLWFVLEETFASRPLLYREQEALVRQETYHLVFTCGESFLRFLLRGDALFVFLGLIRFIRENNVLNPTEDDDALVVRRFYHNTYRVVANKVEFVTVVGVLHSNPHLLVKHKQMQIVEQRRYISLAE